MSCDRTKQTFEGVIDCFLSDTVDNFVNVFGNDPSMACEQSNLVTQNMKISFKRVNIINDPPGSRCTFNFGQKMDVSNNKICLDINQKLSSLAGQEKQNIIDRAIRLSINNLSDDILYNKPHFVELLKTRLTERLMNTSSNDSSTSQGTTVSNNTSVSCSQKIMVNQQQDIVFSGDIVCNGPVVDISQNAIVRAYMKCVIDPLTDVLKTNPDLKEAFNYSPNADCVYDLVPQNACFNDIRTYKANIISDNRGTGICEFVDGELVQRGCSLSQCEVGDWKEVSLCENGKIKSVRKITKSGVNCPSTVKYDDCSPQSSSRPRTYHPSTPPNLTNITSFIDSHQFLLFKFSFSSNYQKIIFGLICLLFIGVFIFLLI